MKKIFELIIEFCEGFEERCKVEHIIEKERGI